MLAGMHRNKVAALALLDLVLIMHKFTVVHTRMLLAPDPSNGIGIVSIVSWQLLGKDCLHSSCLLGYLVKDLQVKLLCAGGLV